MMNTKRRQILKSFCVYGGLAGVTACAQSSDQPQSRMNSEADQARANRFKGVSGAEWVLSSVDELRWIEILNQDRRYVDAAAGLTHKGKHNSFLNEIPIKLKVTWREQDPNNPVYSGNRNESWSGGKITGSFEIPVAERIPDELLEAARMDHASEWRIYWRIVLPLSAPALAVLAIFSVMWRWNDFLLPLIVLSKSEFFTLQLALNSFQGELHTQWHYLLAMTVITLLPVTLVFAFLQRYITTGIASAGVK